MAKRQIQVSLKESTITDLDVEAAAKNRSRSFVAAQRIEQPSTATNILKQIHAQTVGEKLRADILDDQMVQVYLSAGMLRRIAALAPFEEVES